VKSEALVVARPSAPTASVAVRPRSRRLGWRGWLFVAPYAALLVLFGIVPVVLALGQSFVQDGWNSSGVGFDNFIRIFDDFRFWPALLNVLAFLAIWLPTMVAGTIFFALLLHERLNRFGSVMRFVYFMPTVVSGAASVVVWYFMLQPSLSPFGPALRAMGLESGADVFQDQNLVLIFATIAFVTGAGGWIVIMYGALQSLPADMLEAARIDGAGPVRIALSIKLPNIRKYVVYMFVLTYSAGLQIFVEPQLISAVTNAGGKWWSLNQLSFSYAFDEGSFGAASAISTMLLIVSAAGALVLIYRTNFFERSVD
jgi:multiple sugar transport system permease protein